MTNVVGAWSSFHPVTAIDIALFSTISFPPIGVVRHPITVSTKVENPMRYRFIYSSTVLGPNCTTTLRLVEATLDRDTKTLKKVSDWDLTEAIC